MRSEDCIVISDKISKLNIYGRVRHPINGNSGEVKCGTRPVKGINSARCWVNGYNVSRALRTVQCTCRFDGAYTSPHSGCKVKEGWPRGGKHNIQCDALQEYKAWYNSRRKGGMQRDPSLGRWVASGSLSEGTRLCQSRQGRQKHPDVPEGN